MASKERISTRLLAYDINNIQVIRTEIARIIGCEPEDITNTTVIAVSIEYASKGVGSENFRQSLNSATEAKRKYLLEKFQELGWLPRNTKEVFNFFRGTDQDSPEAQPIEVKPTWRRH